MYTRTSSVGLVLLLTVAAAQAGPMDWLRVLERRSSSTNRNCTVAGKALDKFLENIDSIQELTAFNMFNVSFNDDFNVFYGQPLSEFESENVICKLEGAKSVGQLALKLNDKPEEFLYKTVQMIYSFWTGVLPGIMKEDSRIRVPLEARDFLTRLQVSHLVTLSPELSEWVRTHYKYGSIPAPPPVNDIEPYVESEEIVDQLIDMMGRLEKKEADKVSRIILHLTGINVLDPTQRDELTKIANYLLSSTDFKAFFNVLKLEGILDRMVTSVYTKVTTFLSLVASLPDNYVYPNPSPVYRETARQFTIFCKALSKMNILNLD